MRNNFFNIGCYTEGVVLLVECEDSLQKFLFQFKQATKKTEYVPL